jgi:hypothetical protein
MKRYIYFHICCIHNWKQTVTDIYKAIRESGLYDSIDQIRCGVLGLGDQTHEIFQDPKVAILFQSERIQFWEVVTINALHKYARENPEEEFQVLYLHSKGVRHRGTNPNVIDWITYLTYFNLYQYQGCIALLDKHDAVGVNLSLKPELHYSGNFWWTTSAHIRGICACEYTHYNAPEYWVTSVPGTYVTLWQSTVNHYDEPYPAYLYTDLDIRPHKIVIEHA